MSASSHPPTTAADFVAAAAGAANYELLAARVALAESRTPAIRSFAQDMIRDHGAALAALADAARRAGEAPPSSSLGAGEAAWLAALQGARGEAFDRAYARQQVLAHRQALVTWRGYARDGAAGPLRQAASDDIPMIERHLRAAEGLPPPG